MRTENKKNKKKQDGTMRKYDAHGENIKNANIIHRNKERKIVPEDCFRVYEVKENWLTG